MTDRVSEGARSGDKRCIGKRELVGYPLKLRECNERDLDLDLKKLNDKISRIYLCNVGYVRLFSCIFFFLFSFK